MSSSSGAGGANHNQSWVSGVTHATTQQFRLHETTFATSLGVQADDEYFAELTECAAELLYWLDAQHRRERAERDPDLHRHGFRIVLVVLWFCLLAVSCEL
jgi:hypothetical protein